MTKDKIIEHLKEIVNDIKKDWVQAEDLYGGDLDMIRSEMEMLNTMPEPPIPCVTCDGKPIKEMMVKELFTKINEELDELKAEILIAGACTLDILAADVQLPIYKGYIAEEAADTITAITSMLEAIGIDANMRNEAQKRVNEKNWARARLGTP